MIRVASDGYLTGLGLDVLAEATGGYLAAPRIPVQSKGRGRAVYNYTLDRPSDDDDEILVLISVFTEVIQ